MARISTYAVSSPAELTDELIGSDINKATKNFSVQSILDLSGATTGTANTLSMFSSAGLVDSIITQDAAGNSISIGSEDSQEVTIEAILNIQGPVKDSGGSLGGDQQVLVSNANGGVTWGAYATDTVKGTGTLGFVAKWSATDTLQDSTIFENGNKVGIGVTSAFPQEKLHVQGSIYTTPIAYSSDQDAYALRMGSANNTSFDMGIKIKSNSGGTPYMSLESHNTEDLIVLKGGLVGIGTGGTNPEDKLHVMGAVRAVAAGGNGFGFLTNRGTSSSASGIRWDNNNSSLILKDSTNAVTTKISSSGFSWFNGGSVGFGTATPSASVQMVVPGTSGKALLLSNVGDNSAYDSVRVTYSGYGTGSPECIFKPKTQPGSGIVNTYFRFKTNGGEVAGNKANVTVDGKVGIGTTNDVIASQLTVGQGDIEITKFATGLILRSNNGTRYRITVANDGTLTTTAV